MVGHDRVLRRRYDRQCVDIFGGVLDVAIVVVMVDRSVLGVVVEVDPVELASTSAQAAAVLILLLLLFRAK